MDDSIFYHEDFYKQIELVPEENYFKVILDINNNQQNYNSSEHDFNAIKERGSQVIKTENLNIHIDSIKKALLPFTFNFFTNVTTGYGNSITKKQNTIALGFERIAIFFEFNHLGMVTNIWVTQSTVLPKISNPKNLQNALIVLGNHFKLILIDWNEETLIRLSSTVAVQHYLKETFAFNFLSE